jgi:hypothetical protein
MAPNGDDESGVTLHDISIPVGDETVVGVRYEPSTDGPSPAILMATPYRAHDRITFGSYDPSLRYFAAHGYEVVAVDLLGTGASSGAKPESFDPGETAEVVSIIEWLADRGWTSGDVGMFGKSYGGWTQLRAAVENPPALKAIVPISIANSQYEVARPGGAFNFLRSTMWATQMQASQALPTGTRDPDGRWATVWKDRLASLEAARPWLFNSLDHDTRDDYWEDRDVPVEHIEVPTFAVCGYRDLHTGSVVDYFDRIDAPKRLLLGPWRHTMPHRGAENAVDFRRQALAWYDHFLKGRPSDRLDGPTVVYYTERAGGWKRDAGVWRGADAWTGATADDTVTFALGADGIVPASSFEAGAIERTYEFDQTVGVNSMERIGMIQHTNLDARPDDARSLVFETAPLERALELTGDGRLTVRLSSTTSDPLVVARLVDVDREGISRPVSHGYLRASRRESHEEPSPIEPGREYELEIPFHPRSHVFEPGHRIRLGLSAAYFPRAEPAPEQGSFTVASSPGNPSVLTLPGREHSGDVSFDDTVTMSPPDTELVPVSSQFVVGSDEDWHLSRQPDHESVTFTATKTTRLRPPNGSELTWSHDVEAGVPARDPRAAYVRNDVTATLELPMETIVSTATSRVTRDYATLDSRVTVDGQVVFDQQWLR